MKNNIFKLFLGVLLLGGFASAQINTLTQTSLAAAVPTSTTATITVTSATGINVSATQKTLLYVEHEAMLATAISGKVVTVERGYANTNASPHPNGVMVLLGQPDWFYSGSPQGSCTTASVYASPYVDLSTGDEWLCSSISGKWVPGFNNRYQSGNESVTTAVASAAGLITPSGPLFHITGTSAITGFNIPVGFDASAAGQGQICVIPDGIFTTTTANNIALASTAVVNKLLCWQWDATNSKFVPTY